MRSIAHLTLAFAAAFASVLALPSMAQDLPGRVGRIAHIEGTAAIYQEPDEGWEKAYVNSPVSTENSVWTEPSSRADVRIGGTAIRMEEATQLDISRLDENELDAFVPRGTVAIRVRHFDRNDRVIFNTPHARFSIRANGRYRVDVDPEREESRLTVFTGEARVGSDSGRIRVQAGKTVRVFGGSAPSYVVEAAFRDPFDQWSERRDTGWVESRSLKYVSASMTGYEDLDRYGSWREEPEFGALWYPTRVAADWAPYRDGRWDYVRPWGWTWVDDAPWGYAPFHYGRWVFVRDRWAWTPGRREVRPTWAPALVAWVGGANLSVGVSSSSPSVGWYPLSPWERYQPWYNASPTYVSQVNIIVQQSPQREERRQWAESTRERGITVVNRNVVIDRRPVQQAMIAVRPEVARQVQVSTPATVLPPRIEVIQRRQSVRTQVVAPMPAAASAPATAPGSAPATQRPGPAQAPPTQRGERAGPVARPEFQRRQAVAAPPPEPAKTAPPPVQRVTPPSAAAQQQAREQVSKARDAEAQKAREDQQKAREEQQKAGAAPPRTAAEPAKPTDDPRSREAEAQKARELQQKAAEDQRRTRDDQLKGREAEQLKAREQQQKGVEDQRKARDDQMKGREADQQKAREQQKSGEDQMKARAEQQQKAADDQRKAREDQMKGRDAELQKARDQQQQQQQKAADDQRKAREDQMRGRDAEQQKAREQQQQQQQQQQKAAEDQRKAREDQMKGREAEQQKARAEQQKGRDAEQQKGRDAEQQKGRDAEQQKGRDAEQQKAREDQMKARAEQQKAREEQMKGRGEPQQRQPQQQPQGATPAPPDADAKLTPQERALKRQERDKKAREDKEEEEKKGKAGR